MVQMGDLEENICSWPGTYLTCSFKALKTHSPSWVKWNQSILYCLYLAHVGLVVNTVIEPKGAPFVPKWSLKEETSQTHYQFILQNCVNISPYAIPM